jgi:thiol-disulfide isomerase/thioredoxin
MIIMALLIYFNIDRQFQSYILEKFPNYGSQLTGLEDNDMIKKELNNLSQLDSLNKADNLAPELVVGGQWLNSQALSLAELKGKVVLLDFMTYSCINCIRTFPYLQAWHESYQDNGLVVIGLHSPEFEFEKNPENVKKALTEFGITFPVMQDNDFATWKNYNNKYWPHTFLIDYNGQIVYDHIGEGNYDVTEAKIKELLEQRQEALGEVNSIEKKLVMPTDQLNTLPQSPETYFGSSRNNLLANGKSLTEGIMDFEMPSDIKTNRLYLVGKWRIYPEYAENIDNDAKIIFSYSAKKVFLVAGADQAVDLKIKQDGQDIADHIKVSDEQLYTLIQNSAPGNHTIEIIPQSAGFRAFTFTFE